MRVNKLSSHNAGLVIYLFMIFFFCLKEMILFEIYIYTGLNNF